MLREIRVEKTAMGNVVIFSAKFLEIRLGERSESGTAERP